MKTWLVYAFTGLMALSLLLAGCGGGGGPGRAGFNLSIGANVERMAALALARGTTLSAPLPGASVTVYDFRTGNIIATRTLDSNGFCTLAITPGLNVAIVAVGAIGDANYRLSTILAQTPNGDSEAILTPETSLAAEAIARTYFKVSAIDDMTFQNVKDVVEDYLDNNPDANFVVGGGLFTADPFGSLTSLNTTALADVIDYVAAHPITENLVLAKNAVQQLREAGMPLAAMTGQEVLDAQSVFTDQVQTQYQALGGRMDTLMMPALFGNVGYDDWSVSVFSDRLVMGHGYRVAEHWDGYYTIVDEPAYNDVGKITIKYTTPVGVTPAGIYTLTVQQVGSNTVVLQTFTGDLSQEYRMSIPDADEPGANPSLTGLISLRDSSFPTALTFTGTLSAQGSDPDHYTIVTFNGTLTTPQVSSTGTLRVTFPATVPEGADPGATIHDFPTSFSMSNARITLSGGGNTITLTGAIEVDARIFSTADGPEVRPTDFSLSGGYANDLSKLDFHGEITAEWTNPSASVTPQTADGTLRLNGHLTRSGYPTYLVDLRFTLHSGALSGTISLNEGARTLTGTVSATITADGVRNPTLVLTNQAGVRFTLQVTGQDGAGTVSGNINAGSPLEEVASIVKDEATGGLRVNYTDGTFEVLAI